MRTVGVKASFLFLFFLIFHFFEKVHCIFIFLSEILVEHFVLLYVEDQIILFEKFLCYVIYYYYFFKERDKLFVWIDEKVFIIVGL